MIVAVVIGPVEMLIAIANAGRIGVLLCGLLVSNFLHKLGYYLRQGWIAF